MYFLVFFAILFCMKVYVYDISAVTDQRLKQDALILSDDEIARLDNMISLKRRKEFIASHYLVRKILSAQAKKNISDIELNVLKSGALIPTDPALGFISISHSFDFVAIAHANAPVGLDMEKMRDKDNFNAILEQIDSVKDAAEMIKSGLTLKQAFYRLWTRREAFYKLASVDKNATLDNTYFYYHQSNNFMFCTACTTPKTIVFENIEKY
mgnify:FL=1